MPALQCNTGKMLSAHDLCRHLFQVWICRQIQVQLGLSFDPTDLHAQKHIHLLNQAQLMYISGLTQQQITRLGAANQQWQTATPTWGQCETLDHCVAVVAGLCIDREAYGKIFSSTYWGMNADDVYHMTFQEARAIHFTMST